MAKPTGPQVDQAINLLIKNLINIKDETDKFLLHLADGRIIDTKSWHESACTEFGSTTR